jgi:hypothetical protein
MQIHARIVSLTRMRQRRQRLTAEDTRVTETLETGAARQREQIEQHREGQLRSTFLCEDYESISHVSKSSRDSYVLYHLVPG